MLHTILIALLELTHFYHSHISLHPGAVGGQKKLQSTFPNKIGLFKELLKEPVK